MMGHCAVRSCPGLPLRNQAEAGADTKRSRYESFYHQGLNPQNFESVTARKFALKK